LRVPRAVTSRTVQSSEMMNYDISWTRRENNDIEVALMSLKFGERNFERWAPSSNHLGAKTGLRSASVIPRASPAENRNWPESATSRQTSRTRGSNSLRSAIQSAGFRTFRRIDRNPRPCARFAIPHGPGEHLARRKQRKSVKTLSARDFARSISKQVRLGGSAKPVRPAHEL
jgi:hypothetical protein